MFNKVRGKKHHRLTSGDTDPKNPVMQVRVDKLYIKQPRRDLMIRISFFFCNMTIQGDNNNSSEAVYPVPSRLLAGGNCPTPHVVGMDQYKKMWEESIHDPDTFFSKASKFIIILLLHDI